MQPSSNEQNLSPGDLIVALNDIRAWETDTKRGQSGNCIRKGECAMLIVSWPVGNQLRLKVLRDQRILHFSHPIYAVHRNWKIAQAVPVSSITSSL